MNKKKFATLMMVVALVTSSMTAFAAGENADGTDASTTTSTGSSTVVDTSTVYSVALPTNNALNFLVDPQGLLNIANGTSVKTDELIGAGAIVSAEGAGAFIKNQSSSDIVVTAKLALDTDAATAPTLVNTIAAVSSGDANTANNMLLAVVPGTEKVASIADYTASTTIVPVTAAGDGTSTTTDVSFLLKAADYVIEKDVSGNASYAIADGEDNYDSASFKIGGMVNTRADWTAFNDKTFTLSAVFSFADADGTEVAREDAYGLIAEDSDVIADYESIPSTTQGIAILVGGNTLWVGPDANDEDVTFAEGAEFSNVKINGVDCEYAVRNDYIAITWKNIVDAGQGEPDEDGHFTWVITLTADGVNYTATYTE